MSDVLGPTYRELARYYDALYEAAGKSYAAEAQAVLDLAAEAGVRPRSVLDVACGTGRHLDVLIRTIGDAVGVDLSPEMLEVAAARLGHRAQLVQADLRTLDLGRRFDLVTCLFSAIGHGADERDLDAGIAAMAAHVDDGGLLVVEPWLTPDRVEPGGRRDVEVARTDDGVVARVSRSNLDGDALVLDFAWAVTTDTGVATHEERYRMPLFTRERYLEAMERAGLAAQWHEDMPGFAAARGMLIGSRAG